MDIRIPIPPFITKAQLHTSTIVSTSGPISNPKQWPLDLGKAPKIPNEGAVLEQYMIYLAEMQGNSCVSSKACTRITISSGK